MPSYNLTGISQVGPNGVTYIPFGTQGNFAGITAPIAYQIGSATSPYGIVYEPVVYANVAISQPGIATEGVAGASNTAPITIATSFAHSLSSGTVVSVSGVGGNTAANGTWTIAVVSPTQFTLAGSSGNGAYTSGGTFAFPTTITSAQVMASGSARLVTL